MNDNDKKLLEIVEALNLDVSDVKKQEIEPQKQETLEDVSDLITKSERSNKILSNLDYLLLSGISSGKSLSSLADTYEVSENYIKKVIRSDSGSAFLKEQAQQKADLALSLSTTTVYEGILKYQAMIDDLFRKGQDGLALNYLFGKQSLMEVQASLHKQQQGVSEDDEKGLLNFFTSISVNGGK